MKELFLFWKESHKFYLTSNTSIPFRTYTFVLEKKYIYFCYDNNRKYIFYKWKKNKHKNINPLIFFYNKKSKFFFRFVKILNGKNFPLSKRKQVLENKDDDVVISNISQILRLNFLGLKFLHNF